MAVDYVVNIVGVVAVHNNNGNVALGVSASEMVYLSANVTAFDRLLKTLYWVKEGVYPQINHATMAEEPASMAH